jgi:murein DD-endopeptidase MepM/ murein hydrolase activator NlpD
MFAGLSGWVGGTDLPSALARPTDPPDPATAHKKRLENQIKASRKDLHESYDKLQAADASYKRATGQLVAVQNRYATTQGQLAAAKAAEQVAATRLAEAEQALVAAKAEVASGERQIEKSRAGVGRAVRASYQQHTSLVSLAIVLKGAAPADLATGAQVQRNVFQIQSNAIEGLRNAQAQLASKQAKVAEAERKAQARRAEAAATVQRVTDLTERVAAEKVVVIETTTAKLRAYREITIARAGELNHYYALVNERNRVTRMLIARAAAEKAAAAKRRAAAEARERAEAKREKRRPKPIPDENDDTGSSGRLFVWPVQTYITSPYGMRFHPILRYWKLHDGTDFGGGCGTPIRAAAGGIVTDKYYNGGYGNRVFVSHGIHKGRHLVSVYNHLSRYSTYVGQRVHQGDIIGYVGSTGYSTGCHLHFMIYSDGNTVNPMRWL